MIAKSATITWEEPPTSSQVASKNRADAYAAELRKHPGRWAKVERYKLRPGRSAFDSGLARGLKKRGLQVRAVPVEHGVSDIYAREPGGDE